MMHIAFYSTACNCCFSTVVSVPLCGKIKKIKYIGSGRLPIRQSRQLPKARHNAEARKAPKVEFSDIVSEFVKRKAIKNVLLKPFLNSFINSKHSVFRFYAQCSCLCKWFNTSYILD